jgi:hypothetical protein
MSPREISRENLCFSSSEDFAPKPTILVWWQHARCKNLVCALCCSYGIAYNKVTYHACSIICTKLLRLKKKKNKEGVIKAREESSLVGRSNHFGTRLRTLCFI